MAQQGCYNSMKRLMWKGTFRRGWPRLFKDTAFALHCFLQMNTDLKSQITVPKKQRGKLPFSVIPRCVTCKMLGCILQRIFLECVEHGGEIALARIG